MPCFGLIVIKSQDLPNDRAYVVVQLRGIRLPPFTANASHQSTADLTLTVNHHRGQDAVFDCAVVGIGRRK